MQGGEKRIKWKIKKNKKKLQPFNFCDNLNTSSVKPRGMVR